jgi:exodeoxyribonuclease V alpha subunit
MSEISDQLESFNRIDYAIADFLSRRASATLTDAEKKIINTLIKRLSFDQSQGHYCLALTLPEQKLLNRSGLCCDRTVYSDKYYPLVVDDGFLYFQRYWSYESRLAHKLSELARQVNTIIDLEDLIDRYCGQSETDAPQKTAIKKAVEHNFCIITGGPGTGKTTTICKLLAVLQESSPEKLNIALAAPTGKAAMRLQEAVSYNLAKLPCSDPVRASLPTSAVTLHRLLGSKAPKPYFHHDADKPLAYDVVVIDEASMVDLALMCKLVEALKADSRLILIGDKNQLASVESGSVLADLIVGFPGNTCELTHSFRFVNNIKLIAESINQQDNQSAWALITKAELLIPHSELTNYAITQWQKYADSVHGNAELTDIYQHFIAFQVLCSNRHGHSGSFALSKHIEQALFGLIATNQRSQWYHGRPILITQNNPEHQLFNGDIGICLRNKKGVPGLSVFFQRPDGSVQSYPPSRIAACETAFATTIHKSQGSEFDEVLVVLPDSPNKVLSKELLYTAVTRAKQSIRFVATKDVFDAAINRKISRTTRLSEHIQTINTMQPG